MPIMDVSVTHAPRFFADLVRPPIGDLWVDLSWIRVGADAAIALLLLGAAFIPVASADERESSKDT
jgi:hypothetical protein